MNHHMPAGQGQGQPHIPPALPLHPHSRRQQDYHSYHHPPQPQSPIHHPYANYPHPAHYYSHAGPPPQFTQQRWQHPYANPQMYMAPPPPPPQPQPQPQQMPYQPRSPMVVTSQPYSQAMTPVTRQTPIPPPQMMQPVSHSPRPIPQHVQPHVHPHVHTPVAPPSPAPTPKQEQERPPPQQEATPPPQASSRRQSVAVNPLSLPPEHKMPYYPQLPWYSSPGGAAAFPRRAAGRRRRRQNLDNIDAVALPTRDTAEEQTQEQRQEQPADEPSSETSTIAAPSEPETPATSQAPSENDFTQVSTPATPPHAVVTSPKSTSTVVPTQHTRKDTRTAIAVPNIPGFAKPKTSPPTTDKPEISTAAQTGEVAHVAEEQKALQSVEEPAAQEEPAPVTPPPKPIPKSWADLVRSKNPPSSAPGMPNGGSITNGVQLPKSASLADALKQYTVQNDPKVSFLEPRGLVNTGNMCYMNSVSAAKPFKRE